MLLWDNLIVYICLLSPWIAGHIGMNCCEYMNDHEWQKNKSTFLKFLLSDGPKTQNISNNKFYDNLSVKQHLYII